MRRLVGATSLVASSPSKPEPPGMPRPAIVAISSLCSGGRVVVGSSVGRLLRVSGRGGGAVISLESRRAPRSIRS